MSLRLREDNCHIFREELKQMRDLDRALMAVRNK
jgi:hypothetical protein